MDEDEEEEGRVDVGADRGWFRGGGQPGWGRDAGVDEGGEFVGGGFGVGLEEPAVDLAEHVADRFGFFGELDGEARFELAD